MAPPVTFPYQVTWSWCRKITPRSAVFHGHLERVCSVVATTPTVKSTNGWNIGDVDSSIMNNRFDGGNGGGTGFFQIFDTHIYTIPRAITMCCSEQEREGFRSKYLDANVKHHLAKDGLKAR
ncbi:hypothetical protein OIU77_019555 [Salix suchowensis]|uniref:Uncharacterized protein n=1 Tax=Salix suchowensis TaxID=1278906 RepID=A0ABQ9CGL4_9ROSI|nr:hypothetical protein OIU77_019555 [Salix suchowensis]